MQLVHKNNMYQLVVLIMIRHSDNYDSNSNNINKSVPLI